MCGICGFYISKYEKNKNGVTARLLANLLEISESRGKEAAGLAMSSNEKIIVLREALAASKMVTLNSYRQAVNSFLADIQDDTPFAAIGHARLATNGWQNKCANNQPVMRDGVILVHNGIVVNDKDLWQKIGLKPETELDSEVLAAFIASQLKDGHDPAASIMNLLSLITGNASTAFLTSNNNALYLATNNSSIYYSQSKTILVFASERFILEQVLNDSEIIRHFPGMTLPERLPNNRPLVVFAADDELFIRIEENGTLQMCAMNPSPAIFVPHFRKIEDLSRGAEDARDNIRRCTCCVLPETMPFIDFDEDGVCNYCHNYIKMNIKGRQEALEAMAPYKRADGKPDSLVMLSGGRDSCYGLHYAVRELGLQPIAYTYDWGMVTDIARRNAARLCGALGVEHIIVAADIARKRRNVRKNIEAWLKKPELGMVPLFMAGDKQYFYYAEQVRKVNQLALTVVSENPMELSKFKAGFCGINEGSKRIYNISMTDKFRLLGYYGKQYLANPRYLNFTIVDNIFAFFSSYIMKHNLFHIYRYERWEEEKINTTLQTLYGWECDPGAKSTWRIGDGTAAFYNYIYYTIAGLTENDTLRSNQIREGMLNRDSALVAVHLENQPRWDSMEWYARTIGFNLLEAVMAVNQAPKLYARKA